MSTLRRIAVLSAVLSAFALAGGAAAAEEKKDKAKEPTTAFVDLPTLTAAVIQPSGQRGVLTVQAKIYIPAMTQRIRAARSVPLLLNAYVPALQGWAYRLPPGAAPNVDTLAISLQRATDGVLGPGTRVLLGGVMVN